MKDKTYFFHQTPPRLASALIEKINFAECKILYEPFAGDNAFYDSFPTHLVRHRTEIEDELDFKDFDISAHNIDTVISNPPFKLDGKNAFFTLIEYFFSFSSVKNVYFLANDVCFGSLTPSRRKVLENEGIFINELTTCAVKKWRGRYYFIHFTRTRNDSFKYLLENYEYVL